MRLVRSVQYHESGRWFRSYGNENWEFDVNGFMKKHFAIITI